MRLSEKIIYLRKQNGMSQEELANELQVSRQAVSRWEVGSALPDAMNILGLSKLFEVSADYLLNDNYEQSKSKKGLLSIRTLQIIFGGAAIGFSVIAIFVLGIHSASNRAVVIINDLRYEGFVAYLMFHDIEWLFIFIILISILGIVLLLYPKIKSSETVSKFKQLLKYIV